MTDSVDENPFEPILDLLVYAPVGLLYEYDEVLATLVKRGKSQVQLAKFVGQMAMRQQQAGAGDAAAGSPQALAGALTQLASEAASLLGLAPPRSPKPAGSPSPEPSPHSGSEASPQAVEADEVAIPIPIEGYDDLTAREIIPLLAELSSTERSEIRVHEQTNRARKTVLAKLDRLDPA